MSLVSNYLLKSNLENIVSLQKKKEALGSFLDTTLARYARKNEGFAEDVDYDAIDAAAEEAILVLIEMYTDISDLLKNVMLIQGIGSPIAAAISAGIVDTNKDPSDLKTASTIILPEIAVFLANLGGYAYPKGKKIFVDYTNRMMSITDPFEDSPIGSETIDISQDEFVEMTKTVLTKKGLKEAIEQLKLFGFTNNAEIKKLFDRFESSAIAARNVGFTYSALYTAGAIASAYHGYKRNNDSLGYGILWGLFGGTNTLSTALVQGFAKPLPK
jgi:hypothetical protein